MKAYPRCRQSVSGGECIRPFNKGKVVGTKRPLSNPDPVQLPSWLSEAYAAYGLLMFLKDISEFVMWLCQKGPG